MIAETSQSSWCLEVVRGADAGCAFALGPGEVVLGNALNGEPGIDLSAQEAASPRRMAARQAMLRVEDRSLTLHDLDSPGGTFVNRQRIGRGAARTLSEGDVIQLGSVQMRVRRGGTSGHATGPVPVAPAPPRQTDGFPFVLENGAVCRSWDDFLAVSSQSWDHLRDELTSGRLAAFATRLGRSDLAPDPRAAGTPDDRLDAWIVRLPTTRPARPEMEIHPRSLVIRATPGGGAVRRKIQVRNVGDRMLRGRSSVDPVAAGWLRLVGEDATFAAVEAADVACEVTIPEVLARPLVGSLRIESDGGDATVEVRVDPATATEGAEVLAPTPRPRGLGLRPRVASQSRASRLVTWPAAGLIVRLAMAWAAGWIEGVGSPGLAGPAVLMALVGSASAFLIAVRRRAEFRDLPAVTLAGSIAGAMVAAVLVAVARTIEPDGAPWYVAGLVWAAAGASLAGASLLIIPAKPGPGGRS